MRPMLFRILTGTALVVAALALFLAFDRGREEEPPVRLGAIKRVFPEPNAIALRQDQVGVELAFGYTASLMVDRRIIPDDQLDVVPGINRVSFTPGDGKEIEQLDEGRVCATVEYRAVAAGDGSGDAGGASGDGATSTTTAQDAAAPRPYTWCFTVA